MKGLAFALSLFNRLSAEFPHLDAIGIVEKIEEIARRLTDAGKAVEAAFSDASAGLAAVVEPKAADVSKVSKPADPVPAIVGGAVTPASAIVEVKSGGPGAWSAQPAPTPPAPGIEGIPSGK